MHVPGPAEKNYINLIYFEFGVNMRRYQGIVGIEPGAARPEVLIYTRRI
jgi:hypothetical protein